jgi:hypothetical protein
LTALAISTAAPALVRAAGEETDAAERPVAVDSDSGDADPGPSRFRLDLVPIPDWTITSVVLKCVPSQGGELLSFPLSLQNGRWRAIVNRMTKAGTYQVWLEITIEKRGCEPKVFGSRTMTLVVH